MKCSVCGKEMTEQEFECRHTFHDDDCPNHKLEFIPWKQLEQGSYVECDCDNIAHPACCPLCNSPEDE